MNTFQKLVLYCKKSIRLLQRYPRWSSFAAIVRYGPAWFTYTRPGINSISAQLPWITFPAIHAIKKILRPEMRLFEYGSGGSTLFWASRVKQVVSVEHDKTWYEKMATEMDGRPIKNVDYFLIEATADDQFARKKPGIPTDYISADEQYAGKNFERYVKKIDEYPDAHFDIVMVDGRARPACILHALKKIKKGGYLIVDNTERAYYLQPFQWETEGWQQHDYPGFGTFDYNFSQTTLFKKNNPR